MKPIDVFRLPKPVRIMGRSSSITNSFVNGIIPTILPSEAEISEALEILGMNVHSICCAYCGDTWTEWDHLRPLILGKQPSGYISEIQNLVPACGKCNQSKGNKDWKVWMRSGARLSPSTRGVVDLQMRIEHLERFVIWRPATKICFEELVGKDNWNEYWSLLEKSHDMLRAADASAAKIREVIKDKVRHS